MNLFFGKGAATPQGRLLVADEDNTFLSSVLSGAFGQEPLSKMVLVEKVKADEGRKRIDRGDGSALLIIPKGFQQDYLRNQPVTLRLFTNPSQTILPKIIEETLDILMDGGFYAQKLLGDQFRALDTGQAPSDRTISQASVAISQEVRKLHKYLDPPLIQLETNVVEKKQAQTQNFAALFFPSMIFMSLLFIANGLAIEIWKERALGTLRRLAVAPVSLAAFVAGRLVVVAAILCGVAIAGLAAIHWMAGMPVANLPAAALWMVLSGIGFFLLLLLMALYATSHRAANTLGNLLIFPLAMAGGCFMPFEMMPDWMAAIGKWTPNGWAVIQFKAIMAGSASGTGVAIAALGLAAVSGAAFLLALRRMRRAFLA